VSPPLLRSLAACLSLVLLGACGSGGSSPDAPANGPDPTASEDPSADPAAKDPAVAAQLIEKPWEVVSNKGETYLPDVFYADPSENEQIMPYALDGHVQIDRLIYPTLGNPNLYTKADAKDQFMTVLRIEPSAYAFLGLKAQPLTGSSLSRLTLTNDANRGFEFYLVPRDIREGNTEATAAITGNGAYRIVPSDVLVNAVPSDMPERLKARSTIRFVFDQKAMAKVPAGLYDVRFELRSNGALQQGVYEYQYNAVRVFDTEPDEYQVINVTDTQVSVGSLYNAKTKAHLDDFVQYLNTTDDPNVRNASFITFNGDLHNGGSPGSMRTRTVATTYAEEAKSIIATLKWLPFPIFLTVGNHDGYVSTGQVPSAVQTADSALGDSLKQVVTDAYPNPWKDFSWTKYQSFLDASAQGDALGGFPRDLFTGAFSRTAKGTTFSDGWKELPADQRNYVLYDGFYQWQKTYGPLYYSYKFGKNAYVSMNSYELRQHRRSGWGMYTVNYGGGMSDVQMAWLDRELLRAKVDGSDVILLAHHDPRGGHKGKDIGYYFDQLRFRSVYQSAFNYLVSKVWDSFACELPDWAQSTSQQDSCIHDGLQEWMRPDEDFDCGWDERAANGVCDASLFDPAKGAAAHAYWFSGLELMKRMTTSPQIRTVLLGHTHYNSLEVLQTGDELVPGQMPVDGASVARYASLEIENPIRGFSVLQTNEGARQRFNRYNAAKGYARNDVPFLHIADRTVRFAALFDRAVPEQRFLDAPLGGSRELVVMRLVSNADLANQTYQGRSAYGFAVLHLTKKNDARAYANPQINTATFFVNSANSASGFDDVRTVDIDRTVRMAPHDASNPLTQLYSWL
jgi:hypothetical protein